MLSIAEESVGLAQTLKARDAACSGVFCITGFYKHRYRTLTDFDLEAGHTDDPANSHGVLGQGRQQLRIRARINPVDTFSIIAEADLFSGRLYGDMSTSGSDFLMDPDEFHSTWLGNKGIYRTRMAIADGGELIILAPGVRTFGEDPGIDRMIRKYGYRTTAEVILFVEENDDLRDNLGAAAHLIHGSPEGRFTVTYCPGHLTQQQIEDVGYQYADLDEMMARYQPEGRSDGWHTDADGQRFYFIGNPAMGLWAARSRLQ